MRNLALDHKSGLPGPRGYTSPEPFFFELLRRLGSEYESLLVEHAAIVQENARLRKDVSAMPCETPRLPFEALREALRTTGDAAMIQADLSPFRTPPATPPDDENCATQELCVPIKRHSESDVIGAESDCTPRDVVDLCGDVKPPDDSQRLKGIGQLTSPSGLLELCSVWLSRPDRNSTQTSQTRALLQRGHSQATLYSKSTGTTKYGDLLIEHGWLQKVVRKPSDASTTIWDMLSLAMVSYDCVFVPLQAFQLKTSWILGIMELTTTVFWTLDIFSGLTRGYYTQGVVEMRLKKIAARYAKTWLPIDFCVVLIDWFVLMWEYGPASAFEVVRMRRLLRMTRALRVARLLRLVRIASGTSDFIRNVCSDTVVQVCGIAKLILGMFLACHFIACGWYAVGTLGAQDNELSWVDELRREQGGQSSFISYAYFSALHWSMTQFTPASMEVVPKNLKERLYAICTVLFALVTFSSLVSSITNTMTFLRKKNFERYEQLDLIWRYITEKKVSVEIGNRVYTCYQHHSKKKRVALHVTDIPAFKTLPESLSQQLSGEVFLPVIRPHPLFHHYREVDAESIEHICHNGISELSVTTASSVFAFADISEKMFFLVKGALLYTDATISGNLRVTKLKGSLFCEMPLWVKWAHRGRMNAHRSSELVVLDRNAFQLITINRGCFSQCRDYAALYAERLTAADRCGQDGGFVPTDIWYDFDPTRDMVHQAFGLSCGSQSVDHLRRRFATFKSASGFSTFTTNHSDSFNMAQSGMFRWCMCCRRRIE